MIEDDTTQAYVAVDLAEEHIEPSEASEVVNRLDRGQYVKVFEEANGWSRVTWYYDHHLDGRERARWIKSSSLSPLKPPPAEHRLPRTRLGAALAHSDDVANYWKRFLQAAQRAIDRGLAAEDDFVEWGGWTRSPSSRGYYFLHTGIHVKERIYLHARSGSMAQWHPWMGDKEVAAHLYAWQNGCVLCREPFRLRNLERDRIVPKRERRVDKIANLQLLCSACNRVKGDRPQKWAIGRLREQGVVGD